MSATFFRHPKVFAAEGVHGTSSSQEQQMLPLEKHHVATSSTLTQSPCAANIRRKEKLRCASPDESCAVEAVEPGAARSPEQTSNSPPALRVPPNGTWSNPVQTSETTTQPTHDMKKR